MYSEKEKRLFEFFEIEKDIIDEKWFVPSKTIYMMMALKAFRDEMKGIEVESLRDCCKAMNDNSVPRIKRGYVSKVWDKLIKFEDDKQID